VVTTLDANLQTKAEEVVQARAETNEKNFNATNTGVIALDPSNGNILAMVGSRNYFDDKIDGNYNVTLADRQPGSAFKPFAYAEAFIKGYTPDTVLFDVPTQFSTSCAPEDTTNSKAPCYAPVNYDNKFLGPMTLRDAIAQSRNIPSVKVLYLAGITDTLRLAKAMGVSTLGDPNQYGLTLVLGGGEVTLLDMSSAYGVFAQNGMRYQPISVLKIIDSTGNTIEDNTQPVGSQVIQADAAQKINDILSDSVARAPLGENDLLSFPGRDVAVKTGTTNNYKDAWTIGYTPNLVLGMWVGNNDNTSMVHKVSGFIVGPMWHEIMQYALSETANQSFTRSEYDASSLKPILRGIWQTPGSDGSIHEILYWVDKNNPLGAQPAYPQNDSQYAYWEVGVQRWLAQHGAPALPQPVVPQEATGAASSN
jgi:membrane peptidoglycan carboxypeptidase